MAWQSLRTKVLGSILLSTAFAGKASAGLIPTSAPEIDGPAGIAAIAILVSAGIIAYNRFTK